MSNTLESRPVQDRSVGLDALRGLAILGILIVNIIGFAFTETQALAMVMTMDSFLDRIVYMLVFVLAQGKFVTLFTVMFGAGIYLMNRHNVEQQYFSAMDPTEIRRLRWRDWSVQLRRMVVLFFIGMVHGYFFWYGDVLVQYALLGMLVYFLLGVADRWLILISSILYVAGAALLVGLGLLILLVEFMEPQEIQAEFYDTFWIEQEIRGYQGGLLDQLSVRWQTTLETQLMMIFLLSPMSAALMLMGVVLVRRGFLLGQASTKRYVQIGGIAGTVGLAASAVAWMIADPLGQAKDVPLSLMFLGWVLSAVVAPGISLAILCAVMLWVRCGCFSWVTSMLAKIGRMALTNYLMSSVICGLIFYGQGLGLIGELTLWQAILIVPGVWLILWLISVVWLSVFKYGPMEFIWRSTTYLRLPNMLKSPTAHSHATHGS